MSGGNWRQWRWSRCKVQTKIIQLLLPYAKCHNCFIAHAFVSGAFETWIQNLVAALYGKQQKKVYSFALYYLRTLVSRERQVSEEPDEDPEDQQEVSALTDVEDIGGMAKHLLVGTKTIF